MKILHIPNYYPPHVGGIEDVCHSIISGTKDEYQHRVICFNDTQKTKKEIYEGIPVVRCGVIKKLFSQSLSLSYLKELKKLMKEFDPDIVHFHAPNPLVSVYLLLSLPKKTKLIVHWHSDIIEQDLLYLFYQPIENALLKRADKIIATTPTYIEGSEPLITWMNKVIIIPNTIKTKKLELQPEDEEQILKIQQLYKKKKIIFTFGRHVPYKGLKYLIDAAPWISEQATVVIAGTGPLTEKLKKMPNASKVHFIGRVSDDELRQYLYASFLFAFPSITRNEAFGVALIEAMYCKLPAVTFTIPDSGVNWVCKPDENGLEVLGRDSFAFAEAINKMLSDPPLKKQLGEKGFKRVNDFFVFDAIRKKIISLYEEVSNS